LTVSSALYTSGSMYKVSQCNILILISKSGSACTACPAGESEVPGRECGTCQCERVWWEAARECIPLAERACRMTVRGTSLARLESRRTMLHQNMHRQWELQGAC
jgi:hypothetical protein